MTAAIAHRATHRPGTSPAPRRAAMLLSLIAIGLMSLWLATVIMATSVSGAGVRAPQPGPTPQPSMAQTDVDR